MTLTAGTRFGAYEVAAPIGAGGMGEVYRARDTRLDRDVALKILPDAFAADADRVARFEREAKTLAVLNHPNIAQVYGFEQSGAVRALAMEFVAGEDLSQRVAGGALAPEEAIPIARQIAEALAAAHDQGIVHRDLKPGNVVVRADGAVKVLDFGLAKALDPGAPADPAHSPTLTLRGTMAGVILGTAAYMSPEQARGRSIDKRTDIWAFGCVLYEMLAGRRAFGGDDIADTIAAVLRADPDWNALPPSVPAAVKLLLRRCLEKDAHARVGDIAVARFVLSETIAPAAATPVLRSRRGIAAVAMAASIAGAALAAGVLSTMRPSTSGPGPAPVRFSIAPADAQLAIFGFNRDLSITPDGSAIVYQYRSGGAARAAPMMVRALGSLDARRLEGVIGRDPFLSPDGQWIAYFTGSELRKVPITGGAPVTVFTIGGNARGGSWGPDDRIVFAPVEQGENGLMSVAASGGAPTVLTHRNPKTDGTHWDPYVLPNGRGVLFTIMTLSATPVRAHVALLDLQSGQIRTIVRNGMAPAYAASGHILFVEGGALYAMPFDIDRLEVTGGPVPVVEHVMVGPTGAANYAVSNQGTLVYVPETAAASEANRTLVWVGRNGSEEAILAPPRGYAVARVSPDGTRLALDVRDAQRRADIWIWDLARRTLSPMSLNAAQDMSPVWTPDGRRVIWTSSRNGGNPNLVWQAAEGTGDVDRLSTSGPAQFATSITPDGSRVLLFNGGLVEGSSAHLSTVPLLPSPDGDKPPTPLLRLPGDALNPSVSPDGRWLAYQSDESGQHQVYVRPFPDVERGRTQISPSGGSRPVWARSGRELFYLDEEDRLTGVTIRPSPTGLEVGVPKTILNAKYYAGFSSRGYPLRSFDISPDGQRFLMIKDTRPAVDTAAPPSIVVVLNWHEEIKARVRAAR